MYKSLLIDIVHQYYVGFPQLSFVCVGTRQDCWAEIKRGGKQIAFGKMIDNATHVVLKPNFKKIKSCKNLDFLPKTITHLKIPLPLIPMLNSNQLPYLQSITVTYSNEYETLDFNLADIKLDANFDLKSFTFSAVNLKDDILWFKTAINLNQYKNLEHIGLSIEETEECFEYLHQLTQVKYFSLLCDAKEILDFIPKTAELLCIPCNEKEKDFAKLVDFKRLNFLEIWDLNSAFDCELLKKLPLNEVSLMNMKKLINPLTLLEIDSLERVRLMNCKNPLKKMGKELFYNHQFKELDIGNS